MRGADGPRAACRASIPFIAKEELPVDAWLDRLTAGWLAGGSPLLHAVFNVLLILVATWVALAVVERGIRRFRSYMEARISDTEEAKRVGTLCRVFRYVGAVVITVIAVTLVLDELGISIAPILATAGVAGIAIGFGAQSLVRDYFSGFFILVENQIRQGDVVNVAGVGGLVEEVTLRYVRLRNFEGHVYFVPNGEIRTVGNMTRDYAQALIEVGVAYREDADEALAVMREVGQAMRNDAAWRERMLDDVEMVGMQRWDDSAVILCCRLKVVGIQQWNVKREYLKRLKAAFDARGIEIPFPHLTLYPGQAKDGGAPPLHVQWRAGEGGAPRE
jgi:small-conductance mechanosensitive channel